MTKSTSKSFYQDKPGWAQGLETYPVPYVNPFFGEDEEGRNDIRSVLTVPSARVATLEGPQRRGLAQGEAIQARDIIQALLSETREGFRAFWPPWPPERGDYRRAYLRKLAQYHGVTPVFEDVGGGNLLVHLKEAAPVRPEVRMVSPIEAAHLIQRKAEARTASPTTAGWLRPLARHDERHEFEPYSVYLRRLCQVDTEDPGAGVVYPYHQNKDKRNQQIRLHQEADRYGKAISLRALDKDHVLITLKRTDKKLPVAYDPRRKYEIEAEESPATSVAAPGKVVIHGGAPVKATRDRDRRQAVKASMEDLA